MGKIEVHMNSINLFTQIPSNCHDNIFSFFSAEDLIGVSEEVDKIKSSLTVRTAPRIIAEIIKEAGDQFQLTLVCKLFNEIISRNAQRDITNTIHFCQIVILEHGYGDKDLIQITLFAFKFLKKNKNYPAWIYRYLYHCNLFPLLKVSLKTESSLLKSKITKPCLTIFDEKVSFRGIADKIITIEVNRFHLTFPRKLREKAIKSEIEKIQIFFKSESFIHLVNMPEKVNRNLLRFFVYNKNRPPSFCCVDFVTFIFGMYAENEVNKFQRKNWNFYRFQKKYLFEGDAICLGRKNSKRPNCLLPGKILHFALYIGNGLYLSVFGNNGPLKAATLNAMKTLYNANEVHQMYPKQKTRV